MALFLAALEDQVCLEARGPDAAAFLHGQLSQAVAELDATHAPLAAWADARGRVRALLRVCRLPERWLLVTPRDGAAELTVKLRRFVLRAKATLAQAEDVAVGALLGNASPWLAERGIAADMPQNQMVHRDGVALIRVGPEYWQLLGSKEALAAFAQTLEPKPATAAVLAEIALGIPAVTTALVERFVAQMLNLDELGAVSFSKGCYPGQEVIARVENLGGVKRRARRYAAHGAPPTIGAAVLGVSGQPVGEVIRSAAASSGCELLAVVEHAAADSALVCAGTPLRELPLPFQVPRD
jgi:folate-binding protein YgfZ